MARIEEQAVASVPSRVVGVSHKKLRVKHIYEVGTAHGAAGWPERACSTIAAVRTRMLSAPESRVFLSE